MPNQPKISACLIVKDEAQNIGNCLKSIKDVCDEIIICDTGSTDDTVKIIENCITFGLNIKLYHKQWNDHFAEMRNYSLSKATGDYIFVIDGDEVLEQWQEVDGKYDYYLAQYRVNDGERDFKGWQPRIFKKGIEFDGKRHATVEKALKGMKGASLKTVIKSDYITTEELTAKVDKNIKIHLEQLETEPDNPTINYHLTGCYHFLKDWDKVIYYGMRAMNDEINDGLKATICIHIYNAWAFKGFWCPEYLMKSLELIPMQVTARVTMAIEAGKRSGKELALRLLDEAEAIAVNEQSLLPNDFIYTEQEFTNLRNQIN